MIKKVVKVSLAFITVNVLFLLGLVFFPAVSYAHETKVDEVTIYHNEPLPDHFLESVDESLQALKKTMLYRGPSTLDICVNDDSYYPGIIRALMGDDVFRAFANKSVMMGEFSGPDQMRIWGREVSITQFLTHAMIHNLQFEHHGFWDANPIGGYAEWKWEGYVEYEVLGKDYSLSYFHKKSIGGKGDFDWIELENGLATIKRHIDYLMLAKYCLEVKEMTYDEMMEYEVSEEVLMQELRCYLKETDK